MKDIMIMGTSSNVGKTLVSTILCRVFKKDGLNVIGFKSQNMSSKSYIDKEGNLVGIGQVLQSLACEVTPLAKYNPILLKPAKEHNIELYLDGKFYKKMNSKEFYNMKNDLVPMLEKRFDELKKEFELIVIEGAGSPVELNINDLDLSNVKMAEIANANIILVADIDRGGVFASIYGTIALLPESIKSKVSGIIVNKLRGKKEYFDSGVKIIEEITGIPVLGVLPYVDVNLPEEDIFNDNKNCEYDYEKDYIKIIDEITGILEKHIDKQKLYEIVDIY